MQIGINFENPWALALFPVLAALIIITGRSLRFSTALKKRGIIALRLLLILALILAMASPDIYLKPKKTATIFLADVSDSIRDKTGEMEDFIKEVISNASGRDVTGVIAFADDARVIQMPEDTAIFTSLHGRTVTDSTNIEKALVLARSITPSNYFRRMVLLSDGKETKGNALETARLFARLGYTLDVVPFGSEEKPEVQLDEFTAPRQVNAKERFDVTVKVKSNINTKAVIRLYGNRTLTAEKTVDLYKGENLFTFNDMVDQGGMVSYTAEVTADEDTVFQNNKLSAFTLISDLPRILLVEKDKNGENLVRYIENFALITRVQPDQVPLTLQEIMSYDAFLLVDISAEWLNNEFLKLLEQAVKNQGKGLLTIGGENSYAPGGYRNTPLETILPVDMDITPKEEDPDLGLILVIDKSGSMSSGQYGITKLELAKEAAIRAAEVLEDKDQLGVIAFDDAIQWVIETEPLTNKKKAIDLIGSIRPGGGTQILHPLEEAWLNLRKINTKLKHIILLTDGQAEKYGYEKIIQGVRDDGITLSTVAVGEGADSLLLKALAYGGQGRYYETDEFTDIPSIFAKEAFLAGQKYLQNHSFYPELVTSMNILKGIEAVPQLDGYVATRAKATARTIFRSDIQDPVLAVWQYGLGRTAAWTSDIQGVWTSQWSMWEDAPTFWGNLTGWLIQKNINTGYGIETQVREGKGIITLTADSDNMIYEKAITGTLVSPDGTAEPIRLDAVRPGIFEGTIDKDEPGAYIVNLEVPGDNGTEHISAGVVMPYSREYDMPDDTDSGFLEKLARAGNGRIVTDPADVLKGEVQNTGGRKELTNLLITLSLILLLLDIAFRKLRIPLEPAIEYIRERMISPARDYIRNLFGKRPALIPDGNMTDEIVEITGKTQPEPVRTGTENVKPKENQKAKVKEPDDGMANVSALLNRRKKWK